MDWRSRKIRIGFVLALAVIAAVVAWRTSTPKSRPPCVPGREETRDAAGKVIEIKRTECARR